MFGCMVMPVLPLLCVTVYFLLRGRFGGGGIELMIVATIAQATSPIALILLWRSEATLGVFASAVVVLAPVYIFLFGLWTWADRLHMLRRTAEAEAVLAPSQNSDVAE